MRKTQSNRGAAVFLVMCLVGPATARRAGAVTVDLAYSTLTPCRIINTTIAGGAIAAGTIRDFKVKGTASLAGQGGSSTGCGVPIDATGAMINFVSVAAAGAGDFRAWAWSNPVQGAPNASILNYSPGLNLANGLAVPLCDGPSCTLDLRVQADVSASHLVADVVGYFRKPLPAPAACNSPPCTVALCSDNATVVCATTVSSSSINCVAVSQSGTCAGAANCKVCQGPAVPASSTAMCSDSGAVICAFTTLGSTSSNCSVSSAGGVCRGSTNCKVCSTQ